MKCPFCKSSSITKYRSTSQDTQASLLCLNCHQSFPRSSRGLKRGTWLFVLSVLGLLSPILLNFSMKGLTQFLPSSEGESFTSIVVLGRGPDSQAERALIASQIIRDNPVPIFISGMIDAPPIAEALGNMGVSSDLISGERCSQTTWENGLFSEASLMPQKGTKILLVTDEPHMLRAHLVFQSFGFDVTPYVIQTEEGLFSVKRAGIVLREYLALSVYAFTGKLRSKSDAVQSKNQRQAILKMDDWGCRL